ncbi:hypothetical protein Tco_1486430, partial [Tanacetum coccineum]
MKRLGNFLEIQKRLGNGKETFPTFGKRQRNVSGAFRGHIRSHRISKRERQPFRRFEYVQEVLEIFENGNPTSTLGLTIDSRSPSFTPFGGSDFLMEEIDAFLEHDDSIPPGVDGIYDSEGDTVYLEELLSVINSNPNLSPSPVCEINVPEEIKSSCEDPPDLELK